MVRSFARDQRGNVALTFSLALIPLVGIAGATADYSRLSLKKSELQSVADAAALGAAKLLSTTSGQPNSTRESTAVQAANSYAAGGAPTAQPITTVFLSENAV